MADTPIETINTEEGYLRAFFGEGVTHVFTIAGVTGGFSTAIDQNLRDTARGVDSHIGEVTKRVKEESKVIASEFARLSDTIYTGLLKKSAQTAEAIAGKGGFGDVGENLGKSLGEIVGKALGGDAVVQKIMGMLGMSLAKVLQTEETYRMLGARLAPSVAGGLGKPRTDYASLGKDLTKDALELRVTTNMTAKEIEGYIRAFGRLGIAWDRGTLGLTQYLKALQEIKLYSAETTTNLLETSTLKFGASEEMGKVTQKIDKASQIFSDRLKETNNNIYEAFRSNEFLASSFLKLAGSMDKTGASISGLSDIYMAMTSSFLSVGLRPEQVISQVQSILGHLFPPSEGGMSDALNRTFFYSQVMNASTAGRKLWEGVTAKAAELGIPEKMASKAVPNFLAEHPEATKAWAAAMFFGVNQMEQSSEFAGYGASDRRAMVAAKMEKLIGVPWEDGMMLGFLGDKAQKIITTHQGITSEGLLKALLEDPTVKGAFKGTPYEGMEKEAIAGVLSGIAAPRQSMEDKAQILVEQAMLSASTFNNWGKDYWIKFKDYAGEMLSYVTGKDVGGGLSANDMAARASSKVRSLRHEIAGLKRALKDQMRPPVGRVDGESAAGPRRAGARGHGDYDNIPIGEVPLSTAGGVHSIRYSAGSGVTSGSLIESGKRYQKALMAMGWSVEEANAAAGNMMHESGTRGSQAVGASGDFGLMQWLGPRKRGLMNYAASQGKSPTDEGIQLQWANMERTGESVKYGGSDERSFYKRAFSYDDPVAGFMMEAERPAVQNRVSVTQRRENARAIRTERA